MRAVHWAIAAVLAVLLLPAAARAQINPVVRGNVTYTTQEPLPAGATLSVVLQDVTIADRPATTLAQQTVDVGGRRGPFAYELRYNPVAIVPNRRYVVRADIRAQSVAIYSGPSGVAVLTNGAPNSADITLQRTTNELPSTSEGIPLAAIGLLAAAAGVALARRRLVRAGGG